MDIVDGFSTEVKRKEYLTKVDIKEHIKEVGKQIIEDADKITIDAVNTKSIIICAEIAPGMQATEIEWSITRYADPRIKVCVRC